MFACGLVLLMLAAWASPQLPPSAAPRLAIKGYDAVAYFTLGKPTPGSADITYEWDGARWQFADSAHRELFQRDPEAYAPQYGGYCALGMTVGNRGEHQPEVWAIVDGKLYFNYDKAAREEWRQNPAANIAQADRDWAEAAASWSAQLRAPDAQPLSFFAIPATCLPWKRAMPSSCSDGWRSPWAPAMVVAP